MLLKIPQNIISSLIFVFLGSVFFWFSVNGTLLVNSAGDYSLLEIILNENKMILKVLFLILTLICSYTVYSFNKLHRFIESSSLPFILFTSMGYLACTGDSVSITTTTAIMLSVLALSFILRIHNQSSILGILLLTSLLIGTATILFYPAIILYATVLLTIAFFRPFEVRNYIVVTVGLLLTGFYLFCFIYLFGWSFQFSNIEVFNFGAIQVFETGFIPLILFLLFSLLGAMKMFSDRSKFIVRQRNQLIVISIYILSQFALMLLLGITEFFITLVPIASIFLVYYYKMSGRRWIIDIISLLFIVSLFWLKL